MDLATIVAEEENKLTELFVECGKMGDLVESLAQTSQLLLQAAETGASTKGQQMKKWRREKGVTLAIWSTDFRRKAGEEALE